MVKKTKTGLSMAKWDYLIESDATIKSLYKKWLSTGGVEDFTDPVFRKLTFDVSKKAKAEIRRLAQKYADAISAQRTGAAAEIYRTDVYENEPRMDTSSNKYYILGTAALRWKNTRKMIVDLLVRFYFDGSIDDISVNPYPATTIFRKDFVDTARETFGSSLQEADTKLRRLFKAYQSAPGEDEWQEYYVQFRRATVPRINRDLVTAAKALAKEGFYLADDVVERGLNGTLGIEVDMGVTPYRYRGGSSSWKATPATMIYTAGIVRNYMPNRFADDYDTPASFGKGHPMKGPCSLPGGHSGTCFPLKRSTMYIGLYYTPDGEEYYGVDGTSYAPDHVMQRRVRNILEKTFPHKQQTTWRNLERLLR